MFSTLGRNSSTGFEMRFFRELNERTNKLGLIAILVLIAGLISGLLFLLFKPYRPNIILISVDTLRADHLGCYGYDRNTTLNIDRLARDSVLFTNAIAQSSWTLPSHMSLFTGLYPSGHGVIFDDRRLSERHITLAEILKKNGYRTVAFTDGGYVSQKFGYRGFDQFESNKHGSGQDGIESIYRKAVDWLRKNPSNQDSGPFFLFLHTYQPHAPYDPPPAYDIYSDKSYRGIVVVPENGNDYYESIKSGMSREDYLYVIDKYDGDIRYTDHFLGKLFDELENLELYDESMIIITSDHGENFLDHPDSGISYVGHNELYDEIVKVPLIIKTSKFPENKVIGSQVESIDIMPTVLELLNIAIPGEVEGEGLVKLVKKGSHDEAFAFSERFLKPHNEHDEYRMIRSSNRKLLLRSRNEPELLELELYDLENDPEEKRNLYADGAGSGKLLLRKLEAWVSAQKEKTRPADKIELDEQLERQLKGLGYMN